MEAYESGELASDSDDEKRLFKVEKERVLARKNDNERDQNFKRSFAAH